MDKNKICISYESGCKEQYKSCQHYNFYETSINKIDCEKIKIYIDTNQNFDDSQICIFSEGKCLTRDKQCSDILNSTDCKAFVPKDSNKECIYIENHCKEQYKTCELYDKFELNKNKEDCESIIIQDKTDWSLYKSDVCTFFEGKCLVKGFKDMQCSDIFEEFECNLFQPKDSNKTCEFVENQCKEKYKTCKLYNENVVNKTKEECQSIGLCYFYEGRCLERNDECSNITKEFECKRFTPKDTNKNCAFIKNKCLEQYQTCEIYNKEAFNKNKKECESIVLYDDFKSESNYKCFFKDGICLTVSKICSEITSEVVCNRYKLEEKNKKCIFIDGQCIEQFKTCEDYDNETIKSKEICESILPYVLDENYHYLDEFSKCVFENGHCMRKRQDCSKVKNYYCNYDKLIGENTMCAYEDDECKEVYKSCESYNLAPNKNEKGCKAVKIYYSKEHGKYIDYRKKCVYENNKCVEKEIKNCEDYEPWLDEKYCTMITFGDYKRCFIQDGQCVLIIYRMPWK